MSTTIERKPRTRRGLRFVDLLAGPHGLDGYLEQVRPTLVTDECRAEVEAVDRGCPDAVTLSLKANRAWEGFWPGQFVRLAVEIDGVRRSRCYSLACAAGTGRMLELTVRAHPGGLVSNFLVERAAVGMTVGLSQAEGEFHLPAQRPEAILLISGGSGITPVMSMLRTLCAEGYPGPVGFLHYAPDSKRGIYRQELEFLAASHPNLHLLRSYTRAAGTGELDGHFSPVHLAELKPCFSEAETFACGPPALLEALRGTWANGLEQRLHTESFVPPGSTVATKASGGSIHFSESDLRVPDTGASLLEQAEAAGVPAESGCRMGICHTCSCRKVAGTVKNLLTDEISSAPDEQIQLCISAPLGDLVVEL
jgi:ferredoxin-NADP reductase